MRRWIIFVTVLAGMLVTAGICNAAETKPGVVKAILNNLEVTIDAETGSIVGLKHPDVGTFLDASADQASIIDLAYPVNFYPPLRLASRHSKGVQITKTKDSVIIFWPKLGLSKKFDNIPEKVSATVVFKAAPDGKSVIMTCEIDNQSEHPVRQVLFPDFMGLLPFAGVAETKFRSAGFSMAPFEVLKSPAERISYFYAADQFYKGSNWIEFGSGSYNSLKHRQLEQRIQSVPVAPGLDVMPGGSRHQMILDWMDIGSNKGGISLYPKRWGWEGRPKVMLHLSQETNKLRMLSRYEIEIAPGKKWQSTEYWLTPHKYGWAEGIKPYSKWAKSHFDRKYPVPQRIKKGLGFRTILMCTATAWAGHQQDLPVFEDDKDIIYKYSDLLAVAKEAKEHGINELILWTWGSPWRSKKGLQYPLKTTFPGQGTLEELADAIEKCKEIGVNVNLFLSVSALEEPMASEFGVKVEENWSWAYHPMMIPQFNPDYRATEGAGIVKASNEAWRKKVFAYIRTLLEMGFHSLSWDVYAGSREIPNVYTLTDEIRAIMVEYDPQSSFAGESINNIEFEANHIDYTWNWKIYEDIRPFNCVFDAPRLNANIDTSSKHVKLCFVDNLYMNIMPTVSGNVNGSDSIANNPPLSKALKQCSKLRKQFMDYFVSGRLIGDCILTKAPEKDFHVSAYLLPDSILMFAMNTSDSKSSMPIECDLLNWLKSATGKYEVKKYNIGGKLMQTEEFESHVWKSESSNLNGLGIEIYEFKVK